MAWWLVTEGEGDRPGMPVLQVKSLSGFADVGRGRQGALKAHQVKWERSDGGEMSATGSCTCNPVMG